MIRAAKQYPAALKRLEKRKAFVDEIFFEISAVFAEKVKFDAFDEKIKLELTIYHGEPRELIKPGSLLQIYQIWPQKKEIKKKYNYPLYEGCFNSENIGSINKKNAKKIAKLFMAKSLIQACGRHGLLNAEGREELYKTLGMKRLPPINGSRRMLAPADPSLPVDLFMPKLSLPFPPDIY